MYEQLSVTYSKDIIDQRTNEKTFWFMVKAPGHECTDISVGLSRTGEWTAASSTFFNLEPDVKDQALELSRQLLPKVLAVN